MRGSPAQPCQAEEGASLGSKYLPRTRSPSDGSDVRWYFCKTPLGRDEPAATVPATELVGKGEYFRFSKSDSDALEASFLEREEELVREWWKEYAESRDGPSNVAPSQDGEGSSISRTGRSEYESRRRLKLTAWDETENVGVLVKGGLYEVDLLSRRCLPVYWRGDHRRVLRGHWFARKGGLDWLPLREDLSEQLEIAYINQIWRRRRFQPSGLYAARVNLHGATQGLHALFTGEDNSWEAWLCIDTKGITFVLGLRGGGVKLRRGFTMPESLQPTQDEVRQRKEEQMDDYASKVPVRHVVFMVHGIGQRLEKANLVDDVSAFRQTVASLSEKHLTQYQRDRQRILFIPCQWRRELKLGGESVVEECTLEGVRALRTMLSATVHDVLYYMSPVYCQDIINSLSRSLNQLYGKFLKRNPNYDGKVSIYGHSLGSVLAYDILCHQADDSSTSAAPVADFTTNYVEASERDHPSSSGSENEISSSELGGANDNSLGGGSEQSAVSESNKGNESSTGTNTKDNAQIDQPVQKQFSRESSSPEIEDVDVLKSQVKVLEAKLSALLQDQDSDKGSSLPRGEPPVEQLSDSEKWRSNDAKSPSKRPQILQDAVMDSSSSDEEGQLMRRDSSKKHFTPYISYTRLDFKVETFYALGSPLGVFLSLRNIRIGEGMGQDYWGDDAVEEEIPAVRQMINIFHPYDPVAYRIEPLVCREFVKTRPLFVPYHKGGKRFHIGMQEFQEHVTNRSKAVVTSVSTFGARIAHAVFAKASEKAQSEEEKREKTYGQLMMQRLTGTPDGRLDYQLQDSTFEHQYISVLSSHTAYWHDLDTALFILKHLYREIPREPPTDSTSATRQNIKEDGPRVADEDSKGEDSNSPRDSGRTTASIRHEFDSEDISLTFLSKDAITAAFADANREKSDWMA